MNLLQCSIFAAFIVSFVTLNQGSFNNSTLFFQRCFQNNIPLNFSGYIKPSGLKASNEAKIFASRDVNAEKWCSDGSINQFQLMLSDDDSQNQNATFLDNGSFTSYSFSWSGKYLGSLSVGNEVFQIPKEYCVRGGGPNFVNVDTCSPNCTSSEKICVRKCCNLGYMIDFDGGNLRKGKCLINPKIPYWKPRVYKNLESSVKSKFLEKDEVHWSTALLSCPKRNADTPLKFITSAPLTWGTNNPPQPWKILNDGTIWANRRNKGWIQIAEEVEYCVDGIFNYGHDTDTPDDEVLVLCNSRTKTGYASPLYLLIVFTSAAFLLVIAVVYIILPELHSSVQGCITLSYILSMLAVMLFVLASDLYFTKYESDTSSHIGPCGILGAFRHFFVIYQFSWLTVLNFDLTSTFWLMSSRPNRRRAPTKKEILKTYFCYFLVATTIPTVVVGTGLILDYLFCAKGFYVYPVIGALLVTNFIWMGIAALTLRKFKKSTQDTLQNSVKTVNEQSFLLGVKLFVLMGGAWIFDLFQSMDADERFDQNDSTSTPWYWALLDALAILQPIPLFYILIWKKRVRNLLKLKFPCIAQVNNVFIGFCKRNNQSNSQRSNESGQSQVTNSTTV